MEKTRKSSVSIGAKIGAVLGFILFIVFGLVPGFYFGSSTAILLLSKLIGAPVEATTLARVAVVIGAIMGLFCAFSVCIVGGALFGTVVASLTDALTPRKKSDEESSQNTGKSEGDES
jgi:uncharacterized membrane protein YgaE (UPF0421/DUF939 family)